FYHISLLIYYLDVVLVILTIFQNLDFFFQAEDGIRDRNVTGVQTCALPISSGCSATKSSTPTPSSPARATRNCCKASSPWSKAAGWRGSSCSTPGRTTPSLRSEEHTSELQSRFDLVCRLLLENQTRRPPRSP